MKWGYFLKIFFLTATNNKKNRLDRKNENFTGFKREITHFQEVFIRTQKQNLELLNYSSICGLMLFISKVTADL